MKRAIVFVLSVWMIFSLAACGRQDGGSTSAPGQADEGSGTETVQTLSGQQQETSAEDAEQTDTKNVQGEGEAILVDSGKDNLSGTVPDELEYIPSEYQYPAEQAGTLEKLTYQTWESFSYEDHTQELTKEAWVYLPYDNLSES